MTLYLLKFTTDPLVEIEKRDYFGGQGKTRKENIERMQTAYFLVDYYNVAPLKRGLDWKYNDHLIAIEYIVDKIIEWSSKTFIPGYEIKLRLYGGWHSSISNSKTEAREIIGTIVRKHYPTKKKFRTIVEMADSLFLTPLEDLPHTHRIINRLEPFQVKSPRSLCPELEDECCIKGLDAWRKGKCPSYQSCAVDTENVVESTRQKMVDTAIVADTIAISFYESGVPFPVSNDDDIIPGIICASHKEKDAALIRIQRRKTSPCDGMLDRLGIKYFNI